MFQIVFGLLIAATKVEHADFAPFRGMPKRRVFVTTYKRWCFDTLSKVMGFLYIILNSEELQKVIKINNGRW